MHVHVHVCRRTLGLVESSVCCGFKEGQLINGLIKHKYTLICYIHTCTCIYNVRVHVLKLLFTIIAVVSVRDS